MKVTEIMLRSRGWMRALDQLVDIAGLVSHSQLIEGDLPTTHFQQPFDIVTWSIVHEREQGLPTFNQVCP